MNKSSIKVLVTGDIAPLYRLKGLTAKSVPSVLDKSFLDLVKSSDFSISNMEIPVTDHDIPISKTGPALKGNAGVTGFLKAVNFNLLTLATNHIYDLGKEGLNDTIENIKTAELDYVGAGLNLSDAKRTYYTKFNNGLKLAIVNFTENEWSVANHNRAGANPINPVENFYQIKEAKEQADKVIVISHGGSPLYPLPTPRMKKLFHFYIDAGADAVINHHTHCVSGFEEYKGKPIYYSLGNFLFDSQKIKDPNWFEGMAVELTLSKESISHKYHTFDQCKGEPVLKLHKGDSKKKMDEKISRLNKILNDDEKLRQAFEEFTESKRHLYESYLEPHSNKYFHFLRKKGFFPYLLSKKKKRLLLNLTRCESHREVLHNILINENSNPK